MCTSLAMVGKLFTGPLQMSIDTIDGQLYESGDYNEVLKQAGCAIEAGEMGKADDIFYLQPLHFLVRKTAPLPGSSR